ncbi:hypothetical protein RRG08_056998 [Elysia crispata]|uniref:Major facilitator superfamily (MFS) profile domain-containing protein n=1 Tax=Elysia crispata TaxID=231223 RepID=A0AAE1DAI6_9GAST|nr:hypothetical protein RRG08_056998 [Elysia crispata]
MADGGARGVEADPWRWVVLTASFFTMLLNAAVSYNVGVLYVAVLDDFAVGTELVSWMMALYSSMFAISGPIASAVLNASDCRRCVFLSGLLSCAGMALSSLVTDPAWFFITLSIVGFGQSLAQVGGSVGLAYYFPSRTVFATGIALSGNGFGSFTHPALLQLLLEAYSLDGAFLILGGVCLNSCICGLLMRPTTFEIKRHLEKKKTESPSHSFKTTLKSAWREHSEILTDGNFLRFLLTVFIFALAFNTTLVFLPECLIESKGYTHMEAATIASFVGIGSLLSRTLVGFAATDQKIGEKLVYVGLNLVSLLVCIAADNLMDYTFGAYFVAFAYGLYVSPCVILFFTLTFYVLGYDNGASGYGIVLMVYGFASLLGPPAYAIMLQIFGCTALFKITGLLFLTSALLSTGVKQHDPAEEKSGLDDDVTKVLMTESALGTTFGSRNFEIIVSVQEPGTDGGDNDHCLEEQGCTKQPGTDGGDNDHCLEEQGCTKQPHVPSDPGGGDAELRCLLDLPRTYDESSTA